MTISGSGDKIPKWNSDSTDKPVPIVKCTYTLTCFTSSLRQRLGSKVYVTAESVIVAGMLPMIIVYLERCCDCRPWGFRSGHVLIDVLGYFLAW